MKTPPESQIRIIMKLNNADISWHVYFKEYNRRCPPPDTTIKPPSIVLGMGTLQADMSLGSLGQRVVTSGRKAGDGKAAGVLVTKTHTGTPCLLSGEPGQNEFSNSMIIVW